MSEAGNPAQPPSPPRQRKTMIETETGTEHRLRELERRLRVIADFTHDWETWEDAGGKLRYVSPACRRISGYEAREFLENPGLLAEIILPEDRRAWTAHRHLPDRAVPRERIAFRIVTREGEIRWVEHACRAAVDEEGSFLGYRASNRDITERRRAEEALRRAELEKEIILDSQLEHVVYQDLEHRILWPNRAACASVAMTREGLIGRRCHEVWAGAGQPCEDCPVAAAIETGQEQEIEKETPDGRAWYIRGYPVRDEQGAVTGAIEVTQEITERRALESQLLQSQKMEAVGILAGGVAHDFNNILTGIVGSAELALRSVDRTSAAGAKLEQIVGLADRASALTRQLLTFSRQQANEPRVLRLNGLIHDLLGMLERLIGEDVDLTFEPGAEPDTIRADSHQLEQVLMNLTVNSRDAMPEGGTIRIRTANRTLAAGDPDVRSGLAPGPYVLLTLADSGAGMDEQVQRRAFEPFFTTKEVGQGTGLGLSTVYGIVRQHGGRISVESQPGRGAEFRILLPVAEGTAEADRPVGRETETGGRETILVVEDEESVRSVLTLGLEARGFRVLAADSPERALQVFGGHAGRIDLMITDVVMPGENGFALYRRLAERSPELKVLFISGYPRNRIAEDEPRIADLPLMQKPFHLADLTRAARRLLDGEPL